MSTHALEIGQAGTPLLRAWLAAAHGEALAADGRQTASLRAFEDAMRRLPSTVQRDENGPYLALDAAHLARWRGHALARFGHSAAVGVLTDALSAHDAEFSRAEAGLRTDLALAYLAGGQRDAAREQYTAASAIADTVGSARQRRRLRLVADSA
jgi:predicted negative regulator of RcsB-dependent stress response